MGVTARVMGYCDCDGNGGCMCWCEREGRKPATCHGDAGGDGLVTLVVAMLMRVLDKDDCDEGGSSGRSCKT